MRPRTFGRSAEPRRWTATDRRYSSYRWRKVRELVLRRDRRTCWAAGCDREANVCDHRTPVYPGMPDSAFFDPAGLRASCRAHNLARALLRDDELTRATTSGVITRDYSRPRPKVF
jgi:5-methylcytosine-specific restriction endonuclease McrA